jgi:hypothetical protein
MCTPFVDAQWQLWLVPKLGRGGGSGGFDGYVISLTEFQRWLDRQYWYLHRLPCSCWLGVSPIVICSK